MTGSSPASVCLVYPPYYNQAVHNVPPIGLLRLAAFLEQQQETVNILDFIFAINAGQLPVDEYILDRCAERILDTSCSIVGFSTQCTTLPSTLGICERLKNLDPSIRVVLGGYGVSFVSEHIFNTYLAVDFIVVGEGEETFHELVQAIKSKDSTKVPSIEGIIYRHPENGRAVTTSARPLIEDLDSLPFPAYHLADPPSAYADINRQKQQHNQPFPIDTGRGCSFSCNFCSSCLMFNRRVRARTPKSIIDEIRFLSEYGVRHFLFTYDLFNVDAKLVDQLCDALIAEDLDIVWEARCRLDLLDRDTTQKMQRAGCRHILIGLESGSQTILDRIRKNLDLSAMRDRIQMVIETGITPIFSSIIGFPYEEPDDVAKTLELSLFCRLHEPSYSTIHLATPLPGTDLYNDSLDALRLTYMTGDLSSGVGFSHGQILAEDRARIEAHPEIFSSFYNIDVPALTIDSLFFAYSTWDVLNAYFSRSIYLLSQRHGMNPWEQLTGFKSACPAALWRRMQAVCEEKDHVQIVDGFVDYLDARLATTGDAWLIDVAAYESAYARATTRARRTHLEQGVRGEIVFDVDADTWLQQQPGLYTADLHYAVDKKRVLENAPIPKPCRLAFVPQADAKLGILEIDKETLTILEAFLIPRRAETAARECFGEWSDDVAMAFQQVCRRQLLVHASGPDERPRAKGGV